MDTRVTWLQQVLRTPEQDREDLRAASTTANDPLRTSMLRGANSDAAPLSADDPVEHLPLAPADIEAWIEAQLLDCQNLARQHGLTKAASILDTALDELALGSGSMSAFALQPIG